MGRLSLFMILTLSLLLCVSGELQHRQQENFQYSSSSRKIVNGKVVDDDSKSGYLRKQTGNMGGNYEEQENMDAEAQRKRDDLLRWAQLGTPLAAPPLGPMGIPTFMSHGGSALSSNQLSKLSSGGLLVDDCDTTSSLSSHRSEAASQYAARTAASRIIPVISPIPVGAVNVDNERYRDANRLAVTRPVSNIHSVHQQAASDRFAASESRNYPIPVQRPVVHSQSQSQSASMQQQYSASQIEESQRTVPVTYTSAVSDEQRDRNSQYHRQGQLKYDSLHDERRGVSAHSVPAQSEVLRTAESQHYGNRNYEESYHRPTATIRAPYSSKAEIDRRVESLDRTVERVNRLGTTDKNSVLPASQVFDDYDDQQQVQQAYASDVSSASSYAQQQSSRDILRRGGTQAASAYNSGSSSGYRPGYTASGYNAASSTGALQSASSTYSGNRESAYDTADSQRVDKSHLTGSRSSAHALGSEASDLLGAVGAGIPGGSYRQESGDSLSYGYHDAGRLGENRSDGIRGTYTRDGNVAASSKSADEMREENGRIKFSSEGSYSKKHEYSESRNYDFPAGSSSNLISQSELDRMTDDQRRAYYSQIGQRFNNLSSKLYNRHGY